MLLFIYFFNWITKYIYIHDRVFYKRGKLLWWSDTTMFYLQGKLNQSFQKARFLKFYFPYNSKVHYVDGSHDKEIILKSSSVKFWPKSQKHELIKNSLLLSLFFLLAAISLIGGAVYFVLNITPQKINRSVLTLRVDFLGLKWTDSRIC